jgi:hypothetical protein
MVTRARSCQGRAYGNLVEIRRSPDPCSGGNSRDCLEPVLGGRQISDHMVRCRHAYLRERAPLRGRASAWEPCGCDRCRPGHTRLDCASAPKHPSIADPPAAATALGSLARSRAASRSSLCEEFRRHLRRHRRGRVTATTQRVAEGAAPSLGHARRTSRNDDEPRTTTTRPRLHRRRNDRPPRATQLTRPLRGAESSPIPSRTRETGRTGTHPR